MINFVPIAARACTVRRGLSVLAAALACCALSGVGAAGAGAAALIRVQPAFSAADGSVLAGVSCPSAHACSAVGEYYNKGASGLAPLAEQWNGHHWTIQRPPDPAGAEESFLTSVSCHPAPTCMAVGYYFNRSGEVPLAERWNGRRWAIQRTPSPPAAQLTVLDGVACVSAAVCIAVGYYDNGSDIAIPIWERWNGHRWGMQRAASDGRYGSFLYAVSCPTATSCSAAGQYFNGADTGLTLAEHWNGRHWKTQPTPVPSGATQSYLAAIACQSATACTAVGSYLNGSSVDMTLAEHWNGRHWELLTAADPVGATESALTAIACHAVADCIAVGYYTSSADAGLTLAEHWNGHHWSIQDMPTVTGGTAGVLDGVRCPSASSCTAVGKYLDSAKVRKTLAEYWNGQHWKIESTPNPAS